MPSDFAELEQMMVDEEQELLSDQTITLHRNNTAGAEIDPATLKRTTVVQGESVSCNTGEEYRTIEHGSGGYVTRNTFIVRAADLTFTPTRKNTIADANGDRWKVITATPELNGKSFKLLAQKTV